MDYRERYEDHIESLRTMHDGRQALVWTALPGVVQSFDPKAMTAVVQPTIKMFYRSPDPTVDPVWLALPLLSDCPVVFPYGGGVTFTLPIKSGDECLVIFSSRCIDNWWSHSGVQTQAELRMHDLSDGFVLVGPRSQPKVLTNVSTTEAQLRSDDGTTLVSLDPKAPKIQVISKGASILVDGSANNITMKAATINLN